MEAATEDDHEAIGWRARCHLSRTISLGAEDVVDELLFAARDLQAQAQSIVSEDQEHQELTFLPQQAHPKDTFVPLMEWCWMQRQSFHPSMAMT